MESFSFLISYRIKRRDEARVVRFRLLLQATHSLSYGKTIYSEDGPQEPRISREFSIPKLVRWRLLLQSSVLSSITSGTCKSLWPTDLLES